MTQNLNPQSAEKKIFRLATFADGIWEIHLGLFFALMSFFPLTRTALGPEWNAALALGVILLLVGFTLLLKHQLILPRIGLVKFGSGTRQKIRNAHLLTWGLVIVTLIVLLLSATGLLPGLGGFEFDLFFAVLIFAFFALIAYSIGLARFYLHGLLLAVGNFAATVLLVNNTVKFGWPLALAGGLIALIGIFALARFLQNYPQTEMETRNARS